MNLNTPVSNLTRVGKSTQNQLKKLKIETVRDLIFYYPFRYEDYSRILPIAELKTGVKATIKAKIELIQNKRSPRRRKFFTEALVSDSSGSIRIIWFNRNYLTKYLKPGMEVYFSGEASIYLHEIYFNNPLFEVFSDIETIHTAGIIPVYHLTEKITQKQMRFLVNLALTRVGEIKDWLPKEIIQKLKLCGLNDALRFIHFPKSQKYLRQAQRRLKFNELFLLQLLAERSRLAFRQSESYRIGFNKSLTQKFVQSLPFELTNSQRRSAWEIIRDLERDFPMNRLLEGDVGSGKTVVAAIAMLNVISNGYKVAYMAPTEILAKQHFETFCKLFADFNIKIGLITREEKSTNWRTTINDARTRKKTNNNEQFIIDNSGIIVGTHALIQEKVNLESMALVIIDEQHRFGVEQRKMLRHKDKEILPHFLSMTATPIPRSLALALYGELDISIINELPIGRKRILTKVVEANSRVKAYEFIKKEISKGRQIFVICPLISPSDKLGVKSVEEEYERLNKNIFPELRIASLHGKLKAKEKEEIMNNFKEGRTNILVATSVVEVGIDIPNATIMMIEGAERFGLAQLHQFRGRVGRGGYQSYCFLFTDNNSGKVRERLMALVNNDNGFSLAEKDLAMRGPGEVYGTKQSGLEDLKIATLDDYALINEAKVAAREILEQSPDLSKYVLLRERLLFIKKEAHLE